MGQSAPQQLATDCIPLVCHPPMAVGQQCAEQGEASCVHSPATTVQQSVLTLHFFPLYDEGLQASLSQPSG